MTTGGRTLVLRRFRCSVQKNLSARESRGPITTSETARLLLLSYNDISETVVFDCPTAHLN